MNKALNIPHNTKVYSVNNGNKSGFSIFIEFSGAREFLAYHRHCASLYKLLSNGIRLDNLRRFKPAWSHSDSPYIRNSENLQNTRLVSTINHLLAVIDEYIKERDLCRQLEKQNMQHKHTIICESDMEVPRNISNVA